MAKNIRALTDEELEFIKNKYNFELVGDFICVSTNGYDRKVLHSIDKPFSINSIRKVTISKPAIDAWINKFRAMGYSLVEVQNAMSVLIVTWQDITDEEVENQLARKTSKIKVN